MLRSKFNGREVSSRLRHTVNASFVCSLQLATKCCLPTSPSLFGFRPAILLAFTNVLRIEGPWLSYVLSRLEFIRIVAPKVACSCHWTHRQTVAVARPDT